MESWESRGAWDSSWCLCSSAAMQSGSRRLSVQYHLLPDGLQVLVLHDLFPQVDPS